MPPGPQDDARRRFLLWAVAFLYAAVGLLAMLFASPKVPYADSWRFLSTFLETPFPANVFCADNGHREVFPNLVRLAELHWFAANQWLQIGAGVALALATVTALLRSFRDLRPDVRAAAAAILCVGLFWLGNARKLAHGSEALHLFLVLLCLVAGLRTLSTLPRDAGAGRAWLAAGLGITATLSFGSGAASFAAFAAVLAVQRATVRQWLPIGAGALLAAAALLLVGGGTTTSIAVAPGEQLDLLLRWLGTPFVWVLSPLLDPEHAARLPIDLLHAPLLAIATPVHNTFGPHLAARWPAMAFGGAGLLWLLAATVRAWRTPAGRPPERLALGLAWFGCTTGVLVVIVRLAYFRDHLDQVTSQRYVPWSMVFWSGLLLAFVLRDGRSARTAAWTVLLVALLFAPSQVWTGRYAWKQLRTAELTALGAAVGVLDRQFPLVETVAADLAHTVPLLRARQKAGFAWPETQALGTQPPAGTLVAVALHGVEAVRVTNLFGPDGQHVQFEADGAPGARLLLLDEQGTVRGLAIRLGPFEPWQGWLRGAVAEPDLRAAALR